MNWHCFFLHAVFPGLSFRLNMSDRTARKGRNQSVLNLFASGKCVLTGIKSKDEFVRFFHAFELRITRARARDPTIFWT